MVLFLYNSLLNMLSVIVGRRVLIVFAFAIAIGMRVWQSALISVRNPEFDPLGVDHYYTPPVRTVNTDLQYNLCIE
jgi:hypothetical protein